MQIEQANRVRLATSQMAVHSPKSSVMLQLLFYEPITQERRERQSQSLNLSRDLLQDFTTGHAKT